MSGNFLANEDLEHQLSAFGHQLRTYLATINLKTQLALLDNPNDPTLRNIFRELRQLDFVGDFLLTGLKGSYRLDEIQTISWKAFATELNELSANIFSNESFAINVSLPDKGSFSGSRHLAQALICLIILVSRSYSVSELILSSDLKNSFNAELIFSVSDPSGAEQLLTETGGSLELEFIRDILANNFSELGISVERDCQINLSLRSRSQ